MFVDHHIARLLIFYLFYPQSSVKGRVNPIGTNSLWKTKHNRQRCESKNRRNRTGGENFSQNTVNKKERSIGAEVGLQEDGKKEEK